MKCLIWSVYLIKPIDQSKAFLVESGKVNLAKGRGVGVFDKFSHGTLGITTVQVSPHDLLA